METRTDREREAAALVVEALREVEAILNAKPQRYADFETNVYRASNERRKFTMKDAKPRAEYAAKKLREAWELLDPADSFHPFKVGD